VRRILGAVAEIEIVLEWQADQIGDRVLRLLGKLERARILVRRRCGIRLLRDGRPRHHEDGQEEQQPGRSLDAWVCRHPLSPRHPPFTIGVVPMSTGVPVPRRARGKSWAQARSERQ
jgi:hypothetical protein